MFELYNKLEIKKQYFNNSTIYIIDNFYKYPEKILSFINSNPAFQHKIQDKKTFNMKHFQDLRHSYYFDDMQKVNIFLQKIINQKVKYKEYNFLTNVTKFIDRDFNDYENNYWYPHKDFGYTALIYFDKENINGTNLYEDISNDFDRLKKVSEHIEPWRPKDRWKLIYTIKSKFNRCVIFNGKFYHGMAIDNDIFFNKYRINQVVFFEDI